MFLVQFPTESSYKYVPWGHQTPLKFSDISSDILDKVDFICGDDSGLLGKASQVVDVTKQPISILRSW